MMKKYDPRVVLIVQNIGSFYKTFTNLSKDEKEK
jgi:hypothetical protein